VGGVVGGFEVGPVGPDSPMQWERVEAGREWGWWNRSGVGSCGCPPFDGRLHDVEVCESPFLPGVDGMERPVEEIADHGRGLVVVDGLGERWPLALQVVHEVAPPVLLVDLLGGLDAGHDPAVLANLGRQQSRERNWGVSNGGTPHGRTHRLLRRSDGRAGRHELVVMGRVLTLVGGRSGTVLFHAGEESVDPGLRGVTTGDVAVVSHGPPWMKTSA
jgi:hypothetical protein